MRATATAREWAGLAVLVLPCLLVSLDAEVLNLAAPQLAAALRPSNVQLLWIMDSYVFVLSGTLIGAGVLGDRVGRRRLLLAGSAAFAGASLLAAFATTPAPLIAARVLMGLAGASLMPSTLALIRAMFRDPRERAVALGVWSAGFSLGGVGAPLIGGVLLEHFWWGSVFVISVPVVVVLLILGPVLLPESRDPSASGFDWPGALLSLSAVLIFVYGLKRLAASGWDFVPLLAVVGAGLLGGLFVRRQRRHPQPLLDLSMFRDGRVSAALTVNALSFFVLYGTQLAVAQYLQLVLGMSPLRAGLWALPSVLAYLLASLLGPRLARRFPAGRVIATGLAVMAAGFGVVAVAGLPAVVAGTVLFSLGLAPVYILTTDLVVTTVRPERAGMAAAVTETGAELGGALGIAVLGSIGVAAYRHGLTAPAPSRFHLPAAGTLADALSRAADLPAAAGSQLRAYADHAYTNAFGLMSVVAAVLVAGAAILAVRVLRTAAPRPAANEPATPRPAAIEPAARRPAAIEPAARQLAANEPPAPQLAADAPAEPCMQERVAVPVPAGGRSPAGSSAPSP